MLLGMLSLRGGQVLQEEINSHLCVLNFQDLNSVTSVDLSLSPCLVYVLNIVKIVLDLNHGFLFSLYCCGKKLDETVLIIDVWPSSLESGFLYILVVFTDLWFVLFVLYES